MGSLPSFPVQREPITFESSNLYTACGKKDLSRCTRTTITEFEKVTEKFFEPVVKKRLNEFEAKEKFEDVTHFANRFPEWDENDIWDLKIQFMAFDLNNDGLIDFPELNKALNELGDKSSSEKRKRYFEEIDIDHSDSIDFEEFLELLAKVSKKGLSEAIGSVGSVGRKLAMLARHLSLDEQMEAGIF
ncbi:fimbrin-like isoform X2 [Apostichopus japonicus]|uniref:fimbrin-like isoform X2 n=1 Tax=Stichopus japonicus TaxID=307972 RepID=UPI003AB18AEC